MALKRIGSVTNKVVSNKVKRTSIKMPEALTVAFFQRMKEDGVNPRFKSRQVNAALVALLKQNNPVSTIQDSFLDVEAMEEGEIVALSLKQDLLDDIEAHVERAKSLGRENLADEGEDEMLASSQTVTLSSFVRTAMALWACRLI